MKIESIFEFVAKLIDYLAWPLTLLFIILMTKKQIGQLLEVMIKFISQSNKMKLGKDGFEIERQIEFLTNSLKYDKEDQKDINRLILLQKEDNTSTNPDKPLEEFNKVAKMYLEVNEQDKTKRIVIKNNLGLLMGQLIIKNNISREYLCTNINDAKIVGLCYSIKLIAEPNDLLLLKNIANKASTLHAKYIITATFGNLIENKNSRVEFIDEIFDIMNKFENGADDNLIRRILITKYIIKKNKEK